MSDISNCLVAGGEWAESNCLCTDLQIELYVRQNYTMSKEVSNIYSSPNDILAVVKGGEMYGTSRAAGGEGQ
jgi:hypothetical protein